MKATKEEKIDTLKAEITKINQHLPASVYVPFVNSKNLMLIREQIQ